MDVINSYAIFNKPNPNESVKLVAKNVTTMAQILQYISTLPATGQYRVYDDSHHGLLVAKITHLDFWRSND